MDAQRWIKGAKFLFKIVGVGERYEPFLCVSTRFQRG